MNPEKSIALLVRDPLKRKLLSFEVGYWRFSEFLVTERLQKEGYKVSSLNENAFAFMGHIVRFISRREWVADYAVSLIQTAQLAFSKKSSRIAISWQGPGFVFAAIRKLLRRSNETKLIIVMYYSYTHTTLKDRCIRFILNKILLDSAIVVCITPSQEKSFVEYFNLPSKQIRRITRGTDASFFTPSDDYNDENVDSYILCAGEFDRDDRLLFEACRGLKIDVIRVTKELGYGQEIQELARRMKVDSKIKVLTKVDANKLRSLYRNALFVVLPLKNDAHPAGLTSLLEAMACGKATIVTQGLTTEGYAEDMKDAVYCKRHDENDLKEKIILLRDHPELRKTIGINARHSVEKKYSIAKDVDGLMKIIEDVLDNK